MQLNLKRRSSLGQTITKIAIKYLLIIIALILVIFLLEKVNFPSPNQEIKIDVSNEIIRLK
tara:strand:- start:819 stop:1001 length:183 start_codon:yes stop_codon:yes gene_type:complete